MDSFWESIGMDFRKTSKPNPLIGGTGCESQKYCEKYDYTLLNDKPVLWSFTYQKLPVVSLYRCSIISVHVICLLIDFNIFTCVL